MNNTIYNEMIRDMTHVSKLASQKFYNRMAPEISQIYFPQSDQKKIKNIVVETDVDTSNKLLEYVTKRVYFYDKNNNNKLDDDEQLAYNAYIYTSKDAIKLKETYDVAEAGEDDILIFVEDNQGDVSSQFCRARVGKNVLNNLKNAGHLYNNRKLLARINEHAPIDEAVLNELLKKGKIENTTLKVLEFLFAAPDYLGPFSPNTFVMKGLGTICEEIAKFINKAKVDDYRWNPQAKKLNEDGTEDETHEFTPFLFPFVTEALDGVDDSKANEYMKKSISELKSLYASQDQAIQNYVKNVDVGRLGNVPIYFPYGGYVNVEVDLVPDSIELFLFNKYLQVKKVIDAVFEKLEGFDFTDLIKKGITTANAFLCGVWNGLVDAISGIFVLLEMVFKAAAAMNDFRQNFSTQFLILLEYVDNFTEAMSSIDFKELYTHLKTKLSDASIGSISLETIAYFSGAFIGFVISLVIEIVVGILFTGGTLSVAAVMEKLAAIFSGLLRAGAKVLKKTFDFSKKLVVNTFKGFKKLLQGIINLLRKGTAGFKIMIDDIFKAFGVYAKEAFSSANSGLIPLLTKAELNLYKNLAKAFFKPFKKLLLRFADNAKVLRRWRRLNPMDSLLKADIDELLKLRSLNKRGYNKNTATMKAQVEVNGEVLELEYKALAGNKTSGEGLLANVNKDYIAKQLGISIEDLMKHFDDIVDDDLIRRFHDSEHKIFSAFDDDILKLQTRYGKESVNVKSVNFKTLYEPCISCKRQMIIRQEMYEFSLKVQAIVIKGKNYAKNNSDLQSLMLK